MFAYAYLCEHYAKASNTVMRVYRNNELLASYFMFPLEFDPFLPFCEKVLAAECGGHHYDASSPILRVF